MNDKSVAQWLLEHPQAWNRVAELVAEVNANGAQQLADRFADMAYEYGYDSDYDGQPDEAQEWHDFDPEC